LTSTDSFQPTDDKPREIYIPPEPSTDESEMFSAGISAGINFDNFDKIQVDVTGDGAELIKKKAVLKFTDANLREIIMSNVQKSGYKKPTPIQKYAIPIIQSRRDLMGCAQTGSGKTAAFILPILDTIMNENVTSSIGQPQALIVAPTRELVIQIFDEARKFSNTSWVKICLAYGGTASQHQGNNIARGCHVLVATPGRLMDFVEKGIISFESLRFLVLDEADRMLDMGFNEKIKEITTHRTLDKEKVQTLMFSATFPEEIQRLAGTYLRNYLFLTVGIVGGASTDVEQDFVEVGKFKKRGKLTVS
jgi:probable ATP-dependent RNA helicase DDX4